MLVMKFGGTSVGDAARMRRVIDLVEKAQRDERVCLVASAVTGITNHLLGALGRSQGGAPIGPDVDRFRDVHSKVAAAAARDLGSAAGAKLAKELDELAGEL